MSASLFWFFLHWRTGRGPIGGRGCALLAVDPRTPGWGQEADPCYLGGWRCKSCPVCPHTPGFTEAERDAAIAARTPLPVSDDGCSDTGTDR